MTLAVEQAFDADTIRSEVQALGRRIGEDYGNDDLLLISLLSGSVIFVADLVRFVERPLRYEFIQVEQSSEDVEDEPRVIQFPIPVEVRDRRVLLVKDVVSTGVIEPYLQEQLVQLGAREAKVAALIDMPGERKTDFQPDYCVFDVERQGTLVGYGLKQNGEGGNLPYLGWHDSGSAG